MRATQHSSRTDSKGRVHGNKHNDRNFDISRSDNIDPGRIFENRYWNCIDGRYDETEKADKMTFSDVELKVYEELFSRQLEATNRTYIANGHPERVTTMDQWKSQRMHAPEEIVVQVGSMDEMPDWDVARDCLLAYVDRLNEWNEAHGSPMVILDVALHMDETVPHIQLRRTWVWDDNGLLRQGQERALESAGVPLPDPDKAPSKRNNRKKTFDSEMREMWLDICEEHGLIVERDPLPDARHNMDKADMIREKLAMAIAKTERLRAEASEMEVSVAVSRAMAEAPLESPKKLLLTDYVAVRKKDYEDLHRRAEGFDAARGEAVRALIAMNEERMQAKLSVERANKKAEEILRDAEEEAATIICAARQDAILDQHKLEIYKEIERQYPEVIQQVEEYIKRDRRRSKHGRDDIRR